MTSRVACIQQKFIIHGSGDRKSKVRVPAWLSEGPILGFRLPIFSCGRRGKGTLWDPFYKSANTIYEDSTLTAYSPPKGPSYCNPLGIGISTYEFGAGDTNIQTIVNPL